MTLIQALKKNRPIRLKRSCFIVRAQFPYNFESHINSEAWLDPEWFLSTYNFTRQELLSNDWEVKGADKKRKS